MEATRKVRRLVYVDVPHVYQRHFWDCGIACVEMAVQWWRACLASEALQRERGVTIRSEENVVSSIHVEPEIPEKIPATQIQDSRQLSQSSMDKTLSAKKTLCDQVRNAAEVIGVPKQQACWTIELCYILQSFSVDHTLSTAQVGVLPT